MTMTCPTRQPKPTATLAARAARRAPRPLQLATACALAALSHTATADEPGFSFRGFGTVGTVHSSQRDADYVATKIQNTGAGHSADWAFSPDTKLGGQLNATLGDKWSGVVQVISQLNGKGNYTPGVEWANIKYQATSNMSLRAGRIVAPVYLLSESRFVGYASAWVRPAPELYAQVPITNNDGVDLKYNSALGAANNTLQAFAGKTKLELSRTTTGDATKLWGVNDTVEVGSLTLRAGLMVANIDLKSRAFEPLFAGATAVAAAANAAGATDTAAQLQALSQRFHLDNLKLRTLTLSAQYDTGDWFALTEVLKFKGDSLLADSLSWYVHGGYRIGAWTPYATYASTRSSVSHLPALTGVPAALASAANGVRAGFDAVVYGANPAQQATSLGLRWDVMKNVAVKGQFDHVTIGEGSKGRLVVPAGVTPAKNRDLYSVAVDFVF